MAANLQVSHSQTTLKHDKCEWIPSHYQQCVHIIRAARISGQYFELLIKNLLKIALKDHFKKFSLNHCYRLEPTGEGGVHPGQVASVSQG